MQCSFDQKRCITSDAPVQYCLILRTRDPFFMFVLFVWLFIFCFSLFWGKCVIQPLLSPSYFTVVKMFLLCLHLLRGFVQHRNCVNAILNLQCEIWDECRIWKCDFECGFLGFYPVVHYGTHNSRGREPVKNVRFDMKRHDFRILQQKHKVWLGMQM